MLFADLSFKAYTELHTVLSYIRRAVLSVFQINEMLLGVFYVIFKSQIVFSESFEALFNIAACICRVCCRKRLVYI